MSKIRHEQINSESATDGHVLTADGAGGTAWEAPPGGTDADAIHDNVSGEISALTEKVTPVDADLLLIEDSEDTNSKKKIQIGSLPTDAGASAFTDLTDVPAAYSAGDGGKLVRVKTTEDGLEFIPPPAGSGDVIGPAGATDGHLALFDGATGKLIRDGGAPASGDVAHDAIWDAKGDLAAGTGADAASRLAVGSNTALLKADSTTATGLKWGTTTGAICVKAGSTSTIGIDRDRTTGSSYVYHSGIFFFFAPIWVTQILWDIKAADDYYLDIYVEGSLVETIGPVTCGASSADNVFALAAERFMFGNIELRVRTHDAASVLWDDNNLDCPNFYSGIQVRGTYYGSTILNVLYSPACKIVGYWPAWQLMLV